MPIPEISTKLQRLADYLDRHHLDGVLLTQRGNFAWITAGKDNHIPNNSPIGVASILATPDSLTCLASSIEAPRFKAEELKDTGIDVITFPWFDHTVAKDLAEELIANRRIATDALDFGLPLPHLDPDFVELRWSLLPEEIARYRQGASRTSLAMEQACRQIKPHDSEHEIAGMLDHHIRRSGCNPLVTLVAADHRISAFRHPIPTDNKVQRYVMLVTCAQFGGLISCLTRFVAFAPLDAELLAKQQAVCNIDAAINLSSKPGLTLSQLFSILEKAYADNSFPEQWLFHHQGGPTGYATREALATPDSPVIVRENQAFAWNPSITGVKSEDTILVSNTGVEFLTAPSSDWPTLAVEFQGHTLRRPNVLQR